MSSSPSHHVVVGGTGAVGSVVVDALLRAGARVSLYLKPKHFERLQRRRYGSVPPSIAIYDHNRRQRSRFLTAAGIALLTFLLLSLLYRKSLLVTVGLSLLLLFATFVSLPHSIAPFHVISAFDAITAPDEMPSTCAYLWLCISSYDLQADPAALTALLASLPPSAVVVTCTPAMSDSAFLLSLFPHPHRLLQCQPRFLTYQAPLVAEEIPATHDSTADAPQGIARYFPPLSSSAVYGSDAQLSAALVRTLNAGGMPSKVALVDPHVDFALAIALLHPLLLAIELSSWSLSQLFSPQHQHTLQLATSAMKECAPPGRLRSLLLSLLLSPSLLRACLFLCLSVMPFDGEAYLVFHGTKVSDQTVLIMKELEEQGEKEGREMASARKLRERVERRRGEQEKRAGSRW